MYETLNLITINLAKGSQIREERKDGVDFLVAPVAMLVPGVLEGANSDPTFYPVDLLANTAERWNGSPLVLNHPQDSSGNFISVNSKVYGGDTKIGFVANAAFEEGKLRAEAWIEIERLKNLDTKLLNQIKGREKVELSTGLLSNVKREQGEFNGKKFVQRLVDFIPDHLAILNSATGACSIFDGCGVLANESGDEPDVNGKAITVEDDEVRRGFVKFLKSLIGVKPQDNPTPLTSDSDEDEESKKRMNKVFNQGDTHVCTKEELVSQVIANCNHFKEDDKDLLNQMSEDRLKELSDSTKAKEPTANTSDDDDKEKDEKEKEEPTVNKEKLKEEVWLEQAPESVKAMFEYSKKVVANEKVRLIGKLTNHIQDDKKKQDKIVALQSKRLEELQDLDELMPEQPQMNQAPQGLFFGAAGATQQVMANQHEVDKENVLDIPEIDWSKENRFAKNGK